MESSIFDRKPPYWMDLAEAVSGKSRSLPLQHLNSFRKFHRLLIQCAVFGVIRLKHYPDQASRHNRLHPVCGGQLKTGSVNEDTQQTPHFTGEASVQILSFFSIRRFLLLSKCEFIYDPNSRNDSVERDIMRCLNGSCRSHHSKYFPIKVLKIFSKIDNV